MAVFILSIMRLATIVFFCSQVCGVTIEKVKLIGDSDSYINMKSKASNKLLCSYRAGYDDPVSKVNWYKDGHRVYTWNDGEGISTAFGDLIGRVATSSKSELRNLHFTGMISQALSGNYTCEIVSKIETVKSKPFHLVVLDIPSDDFVSNVTLMTEMPEEVAAENENKNCTLIWDFKTPAIFPRPNVTCGYYSYLHDDVTNPLPAGLTMHMLNNGSWQAGFEHIHVKVADIPPKKRLGCSVGVPDTSFKRVVKFEDNFALDYLIDSEGCPLWFLESEYPPQYHADEGETNCRGDVVPASNNRPLTVKFWCNPDDLAMFPNGTMLASWSVEMTCDPTDWVWQVFQDESTIPMRLDMDKDLPQCVPNINSGLRCQPSHYVFYLALLALIWHCVRA